MFFTQNENGSNQKKVIIVTTHNKIPSNLQYYLLAKRLIEDGNEVVLIIDSSKKLEDFNGEYYNWVNKKFFPSFFFFLRILLKHRSFEVAVLNFSATKFSFLFKQFVKTVVVTVRSDFFSQLVLRRFFASIKFLFADVIQTNSNYMKDRIRQNYFFTNNIYVLHNSINTKCNFKIIDNFKADNQKIKILFVGNLEKHKGFDSLIHEFREGNWSNQINLTIAGEGNLLGLLNQNIHGIRYLGKVSHNEVLKEMSLNHFLILPAINEAFGQVVIEAMTQKCVPMVRESTGSAEIILHQQTGYVFKSINEAFNWSTRIDSELYKNIQFQIEKKLKEFDTSIWIQNYINLIFNA